ncbi:MAG TPA: DMT family protein [Polyangiaceae bacterium]
MRTILLLVGSNLFMTTAWYGHLRFPEVAQEVIMLVVFVGFSLLWLGERMRWNDGVAFALILAAVYFAFLPAISPG